MTVSYSKSSPYFKTRIINNYLDFIEFRNIPIQDNDSLFEISSTYNYRPDLLAYDLYNDVNLWWVFSVRNKNIIKDPIFDFTAGTKIYIPKLTTLVEVLGI